MEYTEYNVVKDSAEAVQERLKKVAKRALIVDGRGDFVFFVIIGKDQQLPKLWDWYLRVFDAEGAAWGFTLCVKGKQIGTATWGDNAEWGIDEEDNGFEGDLKQTAKALGTTEAKLSKCFDEGDVDDFCKLVGFEHQYLLYPHEREMPDGIELAGKPR